MHQLKGRTVLLTGASGGIGSYIAQSLAEERMNLVLAGRSKERLQTLVERFRSSGVKGIAVETDLRDVKSMRTLVDAANQEFGEIDLLVNNAGIEKTLTYHKLSLEDIEVIVRVNLTAPMLLTRMVLPGMIARKRGHIVNMSSLAGKIGPAFCEPYAATKAALIGFTESFRAEYRGTGVSASVICPGNVEAGIHRTHIAETGAAAPWLIGTSAPEKIATAVNYAIKNDVPEVIVNPGPIRLMTALAEISPRLAEFVVRHLGVTEWFRRVAKTHERKHH